MTSDWELLERFAKGNDQAAFAEIVQRHVVMVHGAARRMLGASGRDADDVVQAVFLLLSQKAGRIPAKGAMAGWLFKATRYCCANVKRRDAGRQKHEREAGMQRQETAAVAEDLAPLLDEALGRLGEKERQAILLRYLEGRTTEETGAVLGISVEAVKKRLERGVEKLRGIFARKGFVVPAAGVAGVMLAESAKAAPAGLGVSVASAGVSGAASATAAGIAKGAAAMMKMAAMKMAGLVMVGVVICLVGGCVIAHSWGRNQQEMAKAPVTAPASAAATIPVAANTRVLLQQILDARQKNQGQLLTWQGHASIASYSREDHVDDSRTASALFFLDAKHDQLKWIWSYTSISVTKDGKNVPTPGFIEQLSGLTRIKTKDMIVRYENNIFKQGVYKRTLVILPGSQHDDDFSGFNEGLDPRWYFTRYGLNLDEYLAMLLRNADTWNPKVSVYASEQRVHVELPGPGGATAHLEFDLAKGGNLVLDTGPVGSEMARCQYDYQKVNGVWVCIIFQYERQNPVDHVVSERRVVKFDRTQVNEAIDPVEFTVGSLHPPIGTPVTDNRTGALYPYDGAK